MNQLSEIEQKLFEDVRHLFEIIDVQKNAIRELRSRVETFKSKVETSEEAIQELRSRVETLEASIAEESEDEESEDEESEDDSGFGAV